MMHVMDQLICVDCIQEHRADGTKVVKIVSETVTDSIFG